MATCVKLRDHIRRTEMSDKQLQTMIEKEANALGLTAEDAITRVKKGEIGENFLWRDLDSLVHLLYE
jgi:hypothetical protein